MEFFTLRVARPQCSSVTPRRAVHAEPAKANAQKGCYFRRRAERSPGGCTTQYLASPGVSEVGASLNVRQRIERRQSVENYAPADEQPG